MARELDTEQPTLFDPENGTAPQDDALAEEIAAEQRRVSTLYGQLDELRVRSEAALRSAAASTTTGTPGALSERDAFVRMYAERVSQLRAVEDRLCFGRLDMTDRTTRYIGRIGISDEQREELLIDWRAPMAEPFYRATSALPGGVLRRRALTTENRRVTALQDEVLDLEAFARSGVAGSHVVLGEGALFASLDAVRSGRMRDIVATIQADQDRVIRAPAGGVLVVQGGPGTGKTAVALHRTAFLLYANRERLLRSGVLLVGPNRVFLRYIEQVLPALGEADAVVMATPAQLYPGVVAAASERAEVAAFKGDVRMAQIVAEAVRRRQRIPDAPRDLVVEGTHIWLDPSVVREARERARRTRAPHNRARVTFVAEILRDLVRRLAVAREMDLDGDTRPELMAELHASKDVRREVNWCWAPITPERLLRDLFANPERLAEATRRLRPAQRALLVRDRTAPWALSDVPLLDEAADLLGTAETEDAAASARAEADRKAEVAYAREVQRTFGSGGMVTADDLARRYEGGWTSGTVADRAGTDREWTYGHVVVDEAQELSAMMWRLLMRRCPTRSMTVVGDVAQTGSPAGADSWAAVFRPHVQDRFTLAELTVNYRTPEQIMDLAAGVLAAAGSSVVAPTSARIGRHEPRFDRVPDVTAALAGVVADEADAVGAGTIAVIAAEQRVVQVAEALTAALGGDRVIVGDELREAQVSVLGVAQAKGLEFDGVVLVEPAEILGESRRGAHDLYVALTRPTQRLRVVHHADLPAGFPTAGGGSGHGIR